MTSQRRNSAGAKRASGQDLPIEAREAGKLVRYEFHISGLMSDTAIAAFPELDAIAAEGRDTTLYGPVRDHAELYGILARFQNFGLTLVEMRQLPD